jgi:hypothetical protein
MLERRELMAPFPPSAPCSAFARFDTRLALKSSAVMKPSSPVLEDRTRDVSSAIGHRSAWSAPEIDLSVPTEGSLYNKGESSVPECSIPEFGRRTRTLVEQPHEMQHLLHVRLLGHQLGLPRPHARRRQLPRRARDHCVPEEQIAVCACG